MIDNSSNKKRFKLQILKKVKNGYDRGMKFFKSEMRSNNKDIFLIIIFNIITLLTIIYSIHIHKMKINLMIYDSTKIVDFEQNRFIPMNETYINNFIKEAGNRVLSLHHLYFTEQFIQFKKYFVDSAYNNFINQLYESNTIEYIKLNEIQFFYYPIDDINKINIISDTEAEIYQMFVKIDLTSIDSMNQEKINEKNKVLMYFKIEKSNWMRNYPAGFVINEIKFLNKKEYKFNNKEN